MASRASRASIPICLFPLSLIPNHQPCCLPPSLQTHPAHTHLLAPQSTLRTVLFRPEVSASVSPPQKGLPGPLPLQSCSAHPATPCFITLFISLPNSSQSDLTQIMCCLAHCHSHKNGNRLRVGAGLDSHHLEQYLALSGCFINTRQVSECMNECMNE